MFDARTAKQLKAGEHITFRDYPGLRLEASGRYHTWVYRYKSPLDGRMRQVKLGRWPALSYAAALGAWEGMRQQRERGGDPAAEKREQRHEERRRAAKTRARIAQESYTVRKLCEDYLTHVARSRKAKGAAEAERLLARLVFTQPIAAQAASLVTRADAFDLIDLHVSTPMQARHLRTELGAAWDYALDAGRLPDNTPNWWRLVKRGKIKSKGRTRAGVYTGAEKRVLTPAEIGELISWLPNFSTLIQDALTLYLWTGTRGAEILAMRADELAWEGDTLWWTIPREKTKMSRHELATDLRVPLFGRAAAVVRRRLSEHGEGYLFPARRALGPVSQNTIGAGVYYRMPYCETRPHDVRQRLTVTRWSPHDLRRSVRTLLASLGCPKDVAESVLGHIIGGVEGTYNRHSYDAERRHWLKLLDDELERMAAAAATTRVVTQPTQ